jgi:hypothetical protein
MRTLRILLVFAGASFATAMMSGQVVTEYIVAYINDHYQTQDGVTVAGDIYNTPNTNRYGLFAQVSGTGLTTGYTFTPPGGSAIPITTVESNGLFFEDAFNYADTTALFAAYPEGNFSMAIPNTNGANQSVSPFPLSGGSFANTPMITGGTWSNGKLMIDPTQNYTLTFTGFTGFAAGDQIRLGIDGPGSDGHDTGSTTAVTSFFIPAGSIVLAPGNTTGAELNFINGITTDTTTITGATGMTGYVSILSFQIQAIPEPSTYAAIFGGLALAGAVIYRRRRVA